MLTFKDYLRRPWLLPQKFWWITKKRPKTVVFCLFVFFSILLAVLLLTRPKPPEYITDVAVKGDLYQVVEAVGEIISERDLKLQFPITGIVDAVYVEEGDTVEEGQELARLRSSGLQADVNSAAAQVASARANLNKLLEGTRPEEIAITEASVQNKRAALAAARESLRTAEDNLARSQQKLTSLENEARVSLAGFVVTAQSDAQQYLSTALTSIKVMDDILEDNDIEDVFLKHENQLYNQLKRDIVRYEQLVDTEVNNARRTVRDYADALALLDSAKQTVAQLADFLNITYANVSALPITPAFSTTDREASKSSIATERTSVQSALSSLDSAAKALRDASANFDTRISAEEAAVVTAQGTRDRAVSDIQTFETSLSIEEAQLELQKAGTRPADIAAARASLNQTFATLQRAQERFNDTIITAPIAGTITKVNLKAGELLSTSFASDAAIAMLGESPYRVEMFISEIDIPKVAFNQTGSIALDAFPDTEFVLKVTEIEPAATEVDGVSKYRTKLDFVGSTDGLKIGMTGDAEIDTDFRADAITVPGRAVLTRDSGDEYVRILLDDGTIEERDVRIGIDGLGGEVQVLDGVEEGEQVVILIKER